MRKMAENIFKNLSSEELRNATRWYNKFDSYDKKNISKILGTFDYWLNGKIVHDRGFYNSIEQKREAQMREAKRRIEGETDYQVIFAIGSTITDKKNPQDIDLLVVTNQYLNSITEDVKNCTLIKEFKKDYGINVLKEMPEEYDRHSDCRIKFELTNKNTKPIDINYQFDIVSEGR